MQQHYHFVYETLQPKYTHCCTCNSSLRNSQKRICPNREVIQEYLTENTGFDGPIPKDGRVCMLVMLQSPLVDIKTKAKKHRYRLAGTYMKHLVPIENLKGANDIIEHAMQSTAIYVAERLLEQECLLLPAVKDKY